MILSGFGCELRPLTSKLAEQLRMWRNQPENLQWMDFQQQINQEEQRSWFRNLDWKKNQYFGIFAQQLIGFIHLKNINEINQEAEAGILIGNSEATGTGVALKASVLLLDYAFEVLQLKKITAKTACQNDIARSYNAFLGFQLEKEEHDFVYTQLSKNRYLEKRNLFLPFLR